MSTNYLHDPIPIGAQAVRDYYLPVACARATVVCGNKPPFPLYGHVKALPNFLLFFRLVGEAGLASTIKTFDGCYNPRNKRHGNGLSMHAYGAAIDINAAEDPMGTAGHMPPEVVKIAEACGLFWGGLFHGEFRDPMHFQKGVEFTSRAALIASGRPVPFVRDMPYKPGLVVHPSTANAKPAPPALAGVKVFGADGRELFSDVGHSVSVSEQTGRLIVRVGA